jgi:hypothetical protein
MDPVQSTQALGQISADGQFTWDGQQWVPLPSNYRVPTPWTRPMQLAVAGLFAVSAVASVATTLIFVNHDAMVRALQAQHDQVPSRMSIDDLANISIGFAIGFVVFFSLLGLVAAIGSFLGWRWMFWAALLLCGLNGLSAFTNIASLRNPSISPVPTAGLIGSELFALLSLALFVWMVTGAIKFGPWAMKKPGR